MGVIRPVSSRLPGSLEGPLLLVKRLQAPILVFSLGVHSTLAMIGFALGNMWLGQVVDRLGVGYDDIKAINPNIIYVSISGFGAEGPWSHKPVYDPIIQALSGPALENGLATAEGRPLLNSVTGEEERLDSVLPLVAKYKVPVVW